MDAGSVPVLASADFATTRTENGKDDADDEQDDTDHQQDVQPADDETKNEQDQS